MGGKIERKGEERCFESVLKKKTHPAIFPKAIAIISYQQYQQRKSYWLQSQSTDSEKRA